VIGKGEEDKVLSEAKKFLFENEEFIKKEKIFSFEITRFLISELKEHPSIENCRYLNHLKFSSRSGDEYGTYYINRNFHCGIQDFDDEKLIERLRELKLGE